MMSQGQVLLGSWSGWLSLETTVDLDREETVMGGEPVHGLSLWCMV